MLTAILIAAVTACGGKAPAPEVENVAEPAHGTDASTWDGEAARFEPDDREWIGAILRELRDTGERDGHAGLVELVDRASVLVQQVDDGHLSKRQLLEAFHAAEERMTDPVEDDVQVKLDDLREAMRRVKRVLGD